MVEWAVCRYDLCSCMLYTWYGLWAVIATLIVECSRLSIHTYIPTYLHTYQARIQGVGAGARTHLWDGDAPLKIHYSMSFKHHSITGRLPLGEILHPPLHRYIGTLKDIVETEGEKNESALSHGEVLPTTDNGRRVSGTHMITHVILVSLFSGAGPLKQEAAH